MPRYIYDVTNLHTQPLEVKPSKRRKAASHDKIDPADTAVCLTCAKKKCTGTVACFKRRKKELAE